jgi:hypothetical protein
MNVNIRYILFSIILDMGACPPRHARSGASAGADDGLGRPKSRNCETGSRKKQIEPANITITEIAEARSVAE